MKSFDTAAEAQAFIHDKIDIPVAERAHQLNDRIDFHTFPYAFPTGNFTNIYDVSYKHTGAVSTIHTSDKLECVRDYTEARQDVTAAISGGFFFLADQYGGLPRQLALNLAISDGKVRSLPVVDREALITHGGDLHAQKVLALGELSLNGTSLSWAGSLTDHEADCVVFGNGNSRIFHEQHDLTGNIRVLDEKSRFTPRIENDGLADVGFTALEDGSFVGTGSSSEGGLDIFGYDAVVRCDKKVLHGSDFQRMQVHTVGSLIVGGTISGALSVGPLLSETDFNVHDVNQDVSLGSKPPFTERPMARTVVYETAEGEVHVRLFDGRPGSEVFPGVTAPEVVSSIREESGIVWGCFLDPGQTAKLAVRKDGTVESYGNRHYLKWPAGSGEKYRWVPEIGRPTASIIGLQ